MKPWFIVVATCALSILGEVPARASPADQPRTAFHYGRDLPEALLDHHDRVVVDPDLLPRSPELARGRRAQLFAYVALVEVGPGRTWARDIPASWWAGSNGAWGSRLVDVRHPGWQQFMFDRVLAPAWAAGFRGFFFDTLDSYALYAKTDAERAACVQALATFIKAVPQRFPGSRIVLNRGFELLPHTSGALSGIVAESLFAGWNQSSHQYVTVAEKDRAWLLGRLQEAQTRYSLPVTVIDYVPAAQKERRREVAGRIAAAGFVPWVSSPTLDDLGTGVVEVMPRKILLVYDGRRTPDLRESEAHMLLAGPVQSMGYGVDYVDASGALPAGNLSTRYAGIATWVPGAVALPAYRAWLVRQLDAGVRLAVFEDFGIPVDGALLRRLGLERVAAWKPPARIITSARWVGKEAAVPVNASGVLPYRVAGREVSSHLHLEDSQGAKADLVVTGNWGGVAAAPGVTVPGPDGTRRWVIDPIEFLRAALGLRELPAPDTTTENGLRTLTIEIEGPGFGQPSELPGMQRAGKVVYDRFLTRYPYPTTVSLARRDVSVGVDANQHSAELEGLARTVLRLPHVEVAAGSSQDPSAGSIAEQVRQAMRFVDQDLSIPGKPVRAYLWPDGVMPDAAAVAVTREAGVVNINRTLPPRLRDADSMTLLAPEGAPVGHGLQVYAPGVDDWQYTGYWHGPFFGYRRALETFSLDEQPIRLRGVGLHFHFLAVTRPASLRALEEVYREISRQPLMPIWLSDYARRVESFDRVSIARRLDGGWEVRQSGATRTLRMSAGAPYPDMGRAIGIAGYRDVGSTRYVHLTGADPVVIMPAASPENGPRLVHANARIVQWQREGDSVRLAWAGFLPFRFAVAGVQGPCVLAYGGHVVRPVKREEAWEWTVPDREVRDARLTCQ